MRLLYPAFVVVLGAWQLGCQPKIGDGCNLSTDCSIRGDRLCDTSQPGGYCTILGCLGNTCPSGATCIAVDPEVPGCGYDDRRSPSRATRTVCLAECTHDSDCRFGYKCQDIRNSPWRGRPLDDGQYFNVCVVGNVSVVDDSGPMMSQAPVCTPGGPNIPPIDASVVMDSGSADSGTDAGADAGNGEAGDAASE
jgi:hypothetical protein